MSVVELGGPRVVGVDARSVCSAIRVHRWMAGEFAGDEAAQAEAHITSCARCQITRAEFERERADLADVQSFESFAAGVAEKLAIGEQQPLQPPQPSPISTPSRWQQTVPWRVMNVAASLVFVGLLGLFVSRATPRSIADFARDRYTAHTFSPTDNLGALDRVRTKGGAGITVFALRAARSFSLRDGEKAQPGDRLLPALEPGGHSQVVVLLVEPGEVSVLYRGAARGGPLPEAFEWTGSTREARLVAVYADGPLEAEAVVAAVKAGRVADRQGVEVVERRIER